MKKTILILLSLVLFLPFGAKAYTFGSDTATVGKNQTVNGNFYAVGNAVEIDGKIDGDVICLGKNVTINGPVSGDVICAGQNININGEVKGSVRVLGNTIVLNSKIGHNAMFLAKNLTLGDKGQVGWDLAMIADSADIEGKIGRNLNGDIAQMNLAGEVNGDVNLKINNDEEANPVTVAKTAVINGNVSYTNGQEIKIEDGAKIKGKVAHNFKEENTNSTPWFLARLLSLFSALVIGLVLVSLWRERMIRLSEIMLDKYGRAIGFGALVLFITPLVIFVLLMSMIGIPLALILLAFWLIAVWVSKILVGITLGNRILKIKNKENLVPNMIVGVLLAWILFSIPVLGWAFSFIAILWGLGGIYLLLKNKN